MKYLLNNPPPPNGTVRGQSEDGAIHTFKIHIDNTYTHSGFN